MNMRKVLCLLLIVAMVLMMAACGGETRTVTCDGCGTEVRVDADSKITDEWILFCKTCEKELFGEEGIVARE